MDDSLNAFRWIWVAPSIILGLGIARLLSQAVTVFKSRSRTVIDWVPLAWAACIFIWQVQYLWAVIELPSLAGTWRLADFLLLIGLSLLLFIAAALVLPDSELRADDTLANAFQRDGRWALLALAGWGCNALLANWVLFSMSPLSYEGGLLTALVILPTLFLMTGSRRAREAISVANLALTLWSAWALSPKAY